MSNTKRPPLLSNDAKELERIAWKECATLRQGPKDPYGPMMESWNRGGFIRGIRYGQDIYEAARVKDAELMQMLVDALNDSCDDLRGLLNVISPMDGHMINMSVKVYQDALDIAIAAGFKPSEP